MRWLLVGTLILNPNVLAAAALILLAVGIPGAYHKLLPRRACTANVWSWLPSCWHTIACTGMWITRWRCLQVLSVTWTKAVSAASARSWMQSSAQRPGCFAQAWSVSETLRAFHALTAGRTSAKATHVVGV